MPETRFRGIYAPLATPFDHLGRIYCAKLDHNLSMLLRTTLSGVVVGDHWGEGSLLSAEERIAIWRRVAERVGDRAQVLAAISGCSVAEGQALAREAHACGCTCVLLEAPSLRRIAPDGSNPGLFFRAVADAADLPVLISVRLGQGRGCWSPSRLGKLAAHPSIAGAVLGSTSAAIAEEASRSCGKGFSLIVSDLAEVVPNLSGVACAAMLAVAAVVPFFALSIEEAVRTREFAAASELAARAARLDRLLSDYGVPALKCALDLRSSFGGAPRLPVMSADRMTREEISSALKGLAS